MLQSLLHSLLLRQFCLTFAQLTPSRWFQPSIPSVMCMSAFFYYSPTPALCSTTTNALSRAAIYYWPRGVVLQCRPSSQLLGASSRTDRLPLMRPSRLTTSQPRSWRGSSSWCAPLSDPSLWMGFLAGGRTSRPLVAFLAAMNRNEISRKVTNA